MIKRASWLLLFALLSFTHLAFAGRARSATMVLIVEGDAEAERELAASNLPRLTVQPPDDLLTALARRGIQGSACQALAAARTRQQALLAIRKAMKEVGAAAVRTNRRERAGRIRRAAGKGRSCEKARRARAFQRHGRRGRGDRDGKPQTRV